MLHLTTTKTLFAVFVLCAVAQAQIPPVLVDGRLFDWEDRPPVFDGEFKPASGGIDFGRIWIDSSSDYLIFAMELDQEILIQEDNRLTLYLDTDMNSATGEQAGGLGAELVWTFGDRAGRIYPPSGSQSVDQADIGIVSAPTVSSARFEIAIPLDISPGGWEIFQTDSLRLLLIDRNGGTQAPDPDGEIAIAITGDLSVGRGTEDVSRTDGALRLLSYNVENDGLFDASLTSSFSRIMAAVNPDVILFVEIYNHSASQTADRVEEFLPSDSGQQWFSSATGSDVIIVSRYPILKSFAINQLGGRGNSAFLLGTGRRFGNDMMVVGAHLPCCGGVTNNRERQEEADELMAFIRDVKADGSIEEGTPFVITGDLNLVGDSQQLRTLVTGEIITNVFKPSSSPDWNDTDLKDLAPPVTALPLTYTWENRESTFLPGRLDFFIYTDAVIGVGKRFVLDSRAMSIEARARAGLARIDTGIASDHLPVVADFDFEIPTSIEHGGTPDRTPLLKTYPNPSPGATNFEVTIDQPGGLQIRITDIMGRHVTSIDHRHLAVGLHHLAVDLDLLPGLYIATLISPSSRLSTKFVIAQ